MSKITLPHFARPLLGAWIGSSSLLTTSMALVEIELS